MKTDGVLAQRLATQRLTGPAASGPEQVVRESLAVQAQDAPLARASIALRAGGTAEDVGALVDAGVILRTHVLRPTWHYVAASDLGWLLDLTSAKVLSGLAGRHRQLGLDAETIARAIDATLGRLGPGSASPAEPATRSELRDHLVERGVFAAGDLLGSQVGHLLHVAEQRGLIASGPLRGAEHTYAVFERSGPTYGRAEAIHELVRRFFASHGPVSRADLQRWTRLTLAEIDAAIGELGDRLASDVVDGRELWWSPDGVLGESRPARAHLLPTFDEAFLSHRDVGFPRCADHPAGERAYRFAEAGGGVVVCDLADVGGWRRTVRGTRLSVSLNLAPGLRPAQLSSIEDAARRLAAVVAPGATVNLS